ncbi:MAG: hypothetical protein QGG36_23205 [Pirellulaceae bacterium]|nr:hypothetical protein [Pirellulaceae bacterium]
MPEPTAETIAAQADAARQAQLDEDRQHRYISLAFAGICLTIGLALVVFFFSAFWLVPRTDPDFWQNPHWYAAAVGGALAVIGLAIAWRNVVASGMPNAVSDHDRTYAWALVGVSFVLFLDAVLMMTCMAGFSYHGHLDRVLATDVQPIVAAPAPGAPAVADDAGTSADDDNGAVISARLVLSMGMAVLGALFFVAKSLRTSWEQGVTFHLGRFWSGIWFRLGQAIVYTACLHLLLRMQAKVPHSYIVIMALVVGMFVKIAERTFFGVSQRLFAMIDYLIPLTDLPAAPTPVDPNAGVRPPPEDPPPADPPVDPNADEEE